MKTGEIAEILKALAHPTRFMIVEELLKTEKCVTDITELLNVRQPNISQHLYILKANHIVNCKREGKMKCYFLEKPELIRDLVRLLREHKGMLK
ncbi:MAG: winged helix-turn-helix transcriptional regulator [Thermoplasmatales archaeon]|nr:winged helix-turn-helix transcriptional regulator [Thermoplasmatales archaeon]